MWSRATRASSGGATRETGYPPPMSTPEPGCDVTVLRIGPTNAHLLARVGDVFDEPIQPARVAALVDDPSHILIVAVADHTVVGQCLGVVHLHPDKPTDLYIEDLAVDPAWQRRGVATRLVEALYLIGRDRGCEVLWVATEPDNDAARYFYASLTLSERVVSVFEGDF